MIVLFRLFDRQPLMAHAVSVWGSADALIADIQADGERLHAQIAGVPPDPQTVRALLAQVEDLHHRVVPLEQEFGATLGTASRQIGAMSAWRTRYASLRPRCVLRPRMTR